MGIYKMPQSESGAEITVKRSKFIAAVAPCENEEQAVNFINSVKKQHRDAKHNVSAFKIRNGNLARFSDDGEPNKTAGLPVMQAIEHFDITNCAVVVTRYFGGVLLGTGGLVRAYYEAAYNGIKAGTIITVKAATVFELNCEYSDYSILSAMLKDFELKVIKSDFGQTVYLKLAVCDEYLESFNKKMADVFCSRLNFVALEHIYIGF